MPALSLTTLLAKSVDYAGLFPPAALTMREAVSNYAEYVKSPDNWMLGRFITPVSRLVEFEKEAGAFLPYDSSPWRLSVLCGTDLTQDVTAIRRLNERNIGATIDSVEMKATRIEEILAATSVVPGILEVFVEVPARNDVGALVRAIRDARLFAKVRTGGITADAFPSSTELARFVKACVDENVPFKATAGLHHPLRAEYLLTYEPESERGKMYGYLNLLLAASFLQSGMPVAEAARLLEEESPEAFRFDNGGVSWRSFRIATAELQRSRRSLVRSFGSCSFREPVDDLKSLHFM